MSTASACEQFFRTKQQKNDFAISRVCHKGCGVWWSLWGNQYCMPCESLKKWLSSARMRVEYLWCCFSCPRIRFLRVSRASRCIRRHPCPQLFPLPFGVACRVGVDQGEMAIVRTLANICQRSWQICCQHHRCIVHNSLFPSLGGGEGVASSRAATRVRNSNCCKTA
jgi:hypothetical protein